MAVGLGRDGPQCSEALERSETEEGKDEWEEGEGADARAPCDREREGGGTGVGWSRPGREPGRALSGECEVLACAGKREVGRTCGSGPGKRGHARECAQRAADKWARGERGRRAWRRL